MPIAKTSQAQAQPKGTSSTARLDTPFDGEIPVHPEFYRYFNIDSTSGDEHFKYVVRWASDNSLDLPSALKKIKSLETKLGQPALGETRQSRLYNYVRMSDQIKSANKESSEQIESLKANHRLQLSSIRKTHAERRGKVLEELGRIDGEYKKNLTAIKKSQSEKQKSVADLYSRQIAELQRMREIYK